MKVEVSIDPTCKEPKVIILTDKMTEEIEQIMQQVSSKAADSLAVFSNRGVEMIACNDILRIYTEAKKCSSRRQKAFTRYDFAYMNLRRN